MKRAGLLERRTAALMGERTEGRVLLMFRPSAQLNMTAALTLGQVLTAASAFLVNILSAAALRPEDRGVLALLLQITYILAILVVLGTERPFLRQVKADFPSALRIFIRLVKPGLWLTLLPFLVVIPLVGAGRVELALAVAGMSAYAVFNALGKGVRVAAISASTIRMFLMYVILVQGGILFMSLLLAALRVDSATIWFYAYVVSGALVLVFFAKRASNGAVSDLNESSLIATRRAGLLLLPASFGNTAMVRSDRLILPLLAGTAQLGLYAVVATVMEIATWPVKQWVDASLHRWAGESGERGLPLGVMVRTGALAALLAAFLSAILGGIAFLAVTHLLPPAYGPSTGLIAPLGVASVIYAVSRTQQGMLIAEGHSGRVSMVEICGMLAAIAAYFVLIPRMGALGAAYGSIIGYACAVCVGFAVHIIGKNA